MIFPDEYKRIGCAEEGKTPPEEQNRIYFLSRYILEKTPSGYQLYEVDTEGDGFIRARSAAEKIAEADEIIVCPEEKNIKNRTLLIETSDRLLREENARRQSGQKKASVVIFQGIDKHVTFVKDPDISEIQEIQLIDIYPPNPPWLIDCVRRLDASGIFGDLQIKFTEKTADISIYQSDRTIFPCRSSGLTGKFLDSDRLDPNQKDWVLVGCDTSRQIVETLYPGLSYEFKDMCPMRSPLTKPEKPFVLRCCKSENSGKRVTINGNPGIVVHWGAGEWEIAESIRKLALELQKRKREKN